MLNNAFHLAWILMTTCCMLVAHCIGAGGVMCIGCSESPAGIAFNSDPCTPATDCCTHPGEGDPSHSGDESDGDHGDCGCFDIPKPGVDDTYRPRSDRPVVAPAGPAVPPIALAACAAGPIVDRGSARLERPPTIRLLQPRARQTILRL